MKNSRTLHTKIMRAAQGGEGGYAVRLIVDRFNRDPNDERVKKIAQLLRWVKRADEIRRKKLYPEWKRRTDDEATAQADYQKRHYKAYKPHYAAQREAEKKGEHYQMPDLHIPFPPPPAEPSAAFLANLQRYRKAAREVANLMEAYTWRPTIAPDRFDEVSGIREYFRWDTTDKNEAWENEAAFWILSHSKAYGKDPVEATRIRRCEGCLAWHYALGRSDSRHCTESCQKKHAKSSPLARKRAAADQKRRRSEKILGIYTPRPYKANS